MRVGTIIFLGTLLLISSGLTLAQTVPAFSLAKALATSEALQTEHPQVFQSQTLKMRHRLLIYYLGSLSREEKKFEVKDILKFATNTRNITFRANPPEAVVRAWKELDLCFSEIAAAGGFDYSRLPASAFESQPVVPSDPELRRELLTFSLYALQDSLGKLEAKLADTGESRLKSDAAFLLASAREMEAGIRENRASPPQFETFQAARARWEFSKGSLPMETLALGAEVSALAQTCSEIWRGGR